MIRFSPTAKFLPAFLCMSVAAMFCCSGASRLQVTQQVDPDRPIRVACVGDSITYGFGIKDPAHDSYPAQLAKLLGSKWEVRNFGVNGATVLKKGTRPYSTQAAFRDALAFDPDVVILALGTNDTNAKNWPPHKKDFLSDYLDIIESFSKLATRPKIYVCRPVPLFRDRGKDFDTDRILKQEVIPKINKAAKKKKLTVIDLYSAFEGKSALFSDGVHPNKEGARLLAQEIYAKLNAKPASAPAQQ